MINRIYKISIPYNVYQISGLVNKINAFLRESKLFCIIYNNIDITYIIRITIYTIQKL